MRKNYLVPMKNIFHPETTTTLINRINHLSPDSQPQWGKMNVAQMLAHCNVTYEMVFTDKHPRSKGLMKWILKTFVKRMVVSEKPYPKNGRTAKAFLVADEQDFELEKTRLINHIQKTEELGEQRFDGLESHSFGNLTSAEWHQLFYKHLDHHLRQFGV